LFVCKTLAYVLPNLFILQTFISFTQQAMHALNLLLFGLLYQTLYQCIVYFIILFFAAFNQISLMPKESKKKLQLYSGLAEECS